MGGGKPNLDVKSWGVCWVTLPSLRSRRAVVSCRWCLRRVTYFAVQDGSLMFIVYISLLLFCYPHIALCHDLCC